MVRLGYDLAMDEADPPTEGSSLPAPMTDVDQQAAVDRIQLALANDQIEFSQVDQLFERVYAATSKAEIEAALVGLPKPAQPPPPVNSRHFAPASSFSLIGDVKVGGWLAVGPEIEATALIGDVVIDVSSAAIAATGLDIQVRSFIGDVKVIVPDGARVQSTATSVIGDRKEILVAPIADGPVIRVNVFNLIGDVAVYSLSAVPEGKLRRLWAMLRRSNG